MIDKIVTDFGLFRVTHYRTTIDGEYIENHEDMPKDARYFLDVDGNEHDLGPGPTKVVKYIRAKEV